MLKEKLKNLRKENNLTQHQVARKLNVVDSCYANWEQGRTEPSVTMIRNLCKVFGVSSDELLEIEPSVNKREHKNNADIVSDNSEFSEINKNKKQSNIDNNFQQNIDK